MHGTNGPMVNTLVIDIMPSKSFLDDDDDDSHACQFQSLGALSRVLIFLNFSDVSRIFSFLLLYYLCILDVMIRLPLVLV